MILFMTVSGLVRADEAAFRPSERTWALLDRYCLACHDEDTQKGDIRLDHLSELPLDGRLDLLN
ncbi:MAG: c-type cytochrome domain-containing protein, partial [Verrucomicrobiota bacterium]